MTTNAEDPLLTFDGLRPGTELGRTTTVIDDGTVERWRAACPGRPDLDRGAPPGLLVALMMRGYSRIVQPRPPGNVHAGQTLRFGPRPPLGSTLVITVKCGDKAVRNGRHWVWFDTRVTGPDGVLLLSGRMRLLWAT